MRDRAQKGGMDRHSDRCLHIAPGKVPRRRFRQRHRRGIRRQRRVEAVQRGHRIGHSLFIRGIAVAGLFRRGHCGRLRRRLRHPLLPEQRPHVQSERNEAQRKRRHEEGNEHHRLSALVSQVLHPRLALPLGSTLIARSSPHRRSADRQCAPERSPPPRSRAQRDGCAASHKAPHTISGVCPARKTPSTKEISRIAGCGKTPVFAFRREQGASAPLNKSRRIKGL